MEIALEILGIIIIVFAISIYPHLLQLRLDFIAAIFFKKIKIKRCNFLFTAMNAGFPWGKENRCIVSEIGIIIPMFIIQLIGYLLSFIIFVAEVVFLISKLDLLTLFIISIVILFIEIIADFILLIILWIISKKRINKNKE